MNAEKTIITSHVNRIDKINLKAAHINVYVNLKNTNGNYVLKFDSHLSSDRRLAIPTSWPRDMQWRPLVEGVTP